MAPPIGATGPEALAWAGHAGCGSSFLPGTSGHGSVGQSTKMKFRTETDFLNPPALLVDGGKGHI